MNYERETEDQERQALMWKLKARPIASEETAQKDHQTPRWPLDSKDRIQPDSFQETLGLRTLTADLIFQSEVPSRFQLAEEFRALVELSQPEWQTKASGLSRLWLVLRTAIDDWFQDSWDSSRRSRKTEN